MIDTESAINQGMLPTVVFSYEANCDACGAFAVGKYEFPIGVYIPTVDVNQAEGAKY